MPNHETLFERIINPKSGGLSRELAEYILSLDFPAPEHARYEELTTKAQDQALSDDEQADLQELVMASQLLTIMQAKARMSLREKNSAA